MSRITYHVILRQVALRIDALGSALWNATTPVGLETVYTQNPLTDEMFGSSIYSFSAIRDAILDTEGKIAQAASLSSNRTLRSYIRALSAALSSGSALPTVAATKPVIGNIGAVIDADDGTVLTRQPVALVRNRLLSPLIYLAPAYYFALDGETLLHTRTTVNLECCVYSVEDQIAAYNANEEIVFPDSLAEVYINGSIALLVRDDEFMAQATQAANYFTAFLATLPPAELEQTAA